jgi:TolB-like protein
MTNQHCRLILTACVLAATALLFPTAEAPAATNLAVFNFQLKTGQDDWVWLEKFMSDQMATDLVQDRSLSVVARDRMQLIAQQMKWAPEFATTDAKVMGGIRAQLEIEYLVTGVCSVAGDQLEITAQIVEVASRKEVFRKTVTGKTGQVIDLQKQLSADAMSWFTKRPAGEILKTLPMWTRSIPAVRALYEGMHLYDQGRYAEGWVKFRQASQEDKNYVEAVYWVGKMYYFMYRYDHARRTLEKFVYLDCLHPRMGDALLEYAHASENSNVPLEDLLAMYSAFGKRFPDSLVAAGYFASRGMPAEEWAVKKSLAVLGELGRYRDAAILAASGKSRLAAAYEDARIRNVLLNHATTGELLIEQVQAGPGWQGPISTTARFKPGSSELRLPFGAPREIRGGGEDGASPLAMDQTELTVGLLAPSGHVFKTLGFWPWTDGNDGEMAVSLRPYAANKDIFDPAFTPVGKVQADGLKFQRLPHSGVLMARVVYRVADKNSPPFTAMGVRITATVEQVSDPGAIAVQCADTHDFRVDVDGRFGRFSPGVVGPLPAGEHTLTFRPTEPHSPYGEWTTKATVQSGKVIEIAGRLPWKAGSGNAAIVTACVGRDYDAPDLAVSQRPSAAAIQIDDQAIRLLWPRGGDLWFAVSTDGNSFSRPRRLPLPVSTAWEESDPRLIRDESGRFVLTFISDRDAQHRRTPYSCWSRDMVNWSSPAQISNLACWDYDLALDGAGRLVCAICEFDKVRLLASSDGYDWQALPGNWPAMSVRLLARDGGSLEMYLKRNLRTGGEIAQFRAMPVFGRLMRFASRDGRNWSRGEVIAEYAYDDQPLWIAPAPAKGGSLLLASVRHRLTVDRYLRVWTESAGQWNPDFDVWGFMPSTGSLAVHPKWGYVVSWMSADCGPYVMRSRAMPELLAEAGKLAPASAVAAAKGGPNNAPRTDSTGKAEFGAVRDKPASPKSPVPPPRLPPPGPGDMRFVRPRDYSNHEAISLRDPNDFATAAPGCGTVNPRAIVATVKHNGRKFSLALDSKSPSSLQYDLLRIDLSGKGDFKQTIAIPRIGVGRETVSGAETFWHSFEAEAVNLRFKDRVVPARIAAVYHQGPPKSMEVFLRVAAEGMCQFGQKLHKVHIYDNNNNLHLGDAVAAGGKTGHDSIMVHLDHGLETFSFYGHPLVVDGELYTVTLSADAWKVSATKYAGPTGTIKAGNSAWGAWLNGDNFRLLLQAGPQPAPVPTGKYTLSNYAEYAVTDSGPARLALACAGEHAIEVRAGQSVSIPAGSPVTGTLRAELAGRTVTFRYSEQDARGNPANIILVENDLPNYKRSLRITDSTKRPVYGKEMGFNGSRDAWEVDWAPGEGVSGTFTATVEADTGPFITKPATATFTVK